jgi:hypothetical protein
MENKTGRGGVASSSERNVSKNAEAAVELRETARIPVWYLK